MEPGSILGGKYRIVRELGRGGMGVVYEGVQEELRRPVAVKVMRAMDTDASALERFLREARIAASVTSPHLVNVLDFASGPPAYLVMELLSGVTLAGRLRAAPMSEAEVVALGLQITNVLALVHERGVIHRDIKPANLFLTDATSSSPSVWKLLDFGVAKLAESTQALTQGDGAVLGTIPYMSPEQLFVGGDVTPSADLYSLGVCLFEAMCGRRPTTRSDLAGIVAELHTSATPPLKTVCPTASAELGAIIDRALERSTERRFASAREMHRALELLATRPASSGVAPESESESARPRSPRIAVALGGAVVLTIGAGIAVGARMASHPTMATPTAPIPSSDFASPSVGAPRESSVPSALASGADAGVGAEGGARPTSGTGATSNADANTGLGSCAPEKEGSFAEGKNLVCTSGRWACRKDTGQRMRECGDHCEAIDDSACTACGTACPSDQLCAIVGGSPRCTSCGPWTTICRPPGHHAECKDLNRDPFNCGRCGHVCSHSPLLCVDGECK